MADNDQVDTGYIHIRLFLHEGGNGWGLSYDGMSEETALGYLVAAQDQIRESIASGFVVDRAEAEEDDDEDGDEDGLLT